MTIGNILLISSNEQDIHLTGNPQITFFKSVFKRHTNFSIESINQSVIGGPGYGGAKKQVYISKIGDLLHQIYIVIDTKSSSTLGSGGSYINWVNNTAHSLIKKVSFLIGGKVIDEHDGVWLDIMSELNDPTHEDWPLLNKHAAKHGYLQSKTSLVENKLFIPLQFWFCRNPGLALPLLSLHPTIDVVVEFTLRNLESLVNCDGTNSSITEVEPTISVFADYIFLERDEKAMFTDSDQEYLIEQVQQLGGCGYSQETKSPIDISIFNHPIKELIWVFRDKTAMTENNSKSNLSNLDGTINSEGSTFTQKNDFLNYDCSHSRNEVFIACEPQYDHFSNMTLKLNNMDRFTERSSIYFRTVQPINYHGILPYKKIYMFSFALRPSDQQPTGTMNFSAIDNATMVFNGINTASDNSEISIYAVNYNILKIADGSAGIKYAN